jgi:hypothetical protein
MAGIKTFLSSEEYRRLADAPKKNLLIPGVGTCIGALFFCAIVGGIASTATQTGMVSESLVIILTLLLWIVIVTSQFWSILRMARVEAVHVDNIDGSGIDSRDIDPVVRVSVRNADDKRINLKMRKAGLELMSPGDIGIIWISGSRVRSFARSDF